MGRRPRREPFRNAEAIRQGDTVQVAAGMTLLGATGVAKNGGNGKIEIDLSDWGYTRPMSVDASRLRIIERAPQKGDQLKLESKDPVGRNYHTPMHQERRSRGQVFAEAQLNKQAEANKLAQQMQEAMLIRAKETRDRLLEQHPTPEDRQKTDQDLATHTEFDGKVTKRKQSAYWREW